MKRIAKLGNNRYIQMDFDLDTMQSFCVAFFNGVVTVFVVSIAAITVGAMFGVDITETQPNPTQQTK
jgi:hypothetical protein